MPDAGGKGDPGGLRSGVLEGGGPGGKGDPGGLWNKVPEGRGSRRAMECQVLEGEGPGVKCQRDGEVPEGCGARCRRE